MQGIIVLNKPMDFTSMDCCAIIRKLAHEKKVGHTGTLDPNATGVLPICIGKATRLIEFMDSNSKTYVGGFKLGYSSDTDDIWGSVSESNLDIVKSLSQNDIEIALNSFVGDIMQIPPMYSAKKINGQKLYSIARSGQTVERKAVPVTIYKAQLLSYENGDGLFEIECSRGTYIRTICADLGSKLGCGCIMSSLCRTKAGAYSINDCVDLSDLREHPDLIEQYLRPIESSVSDLAKIELNESDFRLFINGNPKYQVKNENPAAVFYKDKLVGITENYKIKKVFNDNL